METIIRGSLLIERKPISGFRPSADGLSNFGHALTAVDGSQLHERTFEELFLDYRNKLIELGSGTELSKGTLEELLAFFLGFRKQCSEPIGI